MRWKNPELDRIIEEIQQIRFDDPKGIELGRVREARMQEMPITPLMAYNVFTCWTNLLRGFRPLRSVHESGAELGEYQVHVHEDQARGCQAVRYSVSTSPMLQVCLHIGAYYRYGKVRRAQIYIQRFATSHFSNIVRLSCLGSR